MRWIYFAFCFLLILIYPRYMFLIGITLLWSWIGLTELFSRGRLP
jgi:hypothetical protein